MSNELRVGFVVIFPEDGLNKELIRQDLGNICTIVEESDGSLTNKNNIEVPMYCYIMDGSIKEFHSIQNKYNCESLPDNPYYLYVREPEETRSIFI